MKVHIISEHGYEEAILGLSLSYGINDTRAKEVAVTLASKASGHNKFLESICVWLDIQAPRYWWQEFDTYRVGMTKQSESTMHTILKRELDFDDFEDGGVDPAILTRLNTMIYYKEFTEVKNNLPEGFLQRRIVTTNYKTLRNIFQQRLTHRLPQWSQFLSDTYKHLEHKEFLDDIITPSHRS